MWQNQSKIFIDSLEKLQCATCCLEEYNECGDSIDCSPNITKCVIIFVGILMLIFFLLFLYCFIHYFCVGRAYRQHFFQVMLFRNHQLTLKEQKQGIVVGLTVPKKIPVKIADMQENNEEDMSMGDEEDVGRREVWQEEARRMVGLEAAPEQVIVKVDLTNEMKIAEYVEGLKEQWERELRQEAEEQTVLMMLEEMQDGENERRYDLSHLNQEIPSNDMEDNCLYTGKRMVSEDGLYRNSYFDQERMYFPSK